MENLIVTDAVKAKLKTKHKVELNEVGQCFYNKHGRLLTDNRDLHKTHPPHSGLLPRLTKGERSRLRIYKSEWKFTSKQPMSLTRTKSIFTDCTAEPAGADGY